MIQMTEKFFIKNVGPIEVHMDKVLGFDDCYGVYLFSEGDLLMSTYGSEKDMMIKVEKIKSRFEVL